ncbi:hypothetical protein BGZ83_007690 [Gryganskiella cystojenkinii]|nr:hypothetical protein BGZ83_007690 [Gryganskiella cystojenkinii]
MPKSSSKRKKEKNADFKKTKLKVGKKKAVSDSFTDTSFKSKAISLPSQSITHDKTTLLTNSRNVTFSELMTQLKHYSPSTRKDALLGLRDLFHRHPHLLPLHLGVLVNTIVRLLIDDSSMVRKGLQTFLAEFIPMLHPRDVHPFLPLLVVYTCSAMTHILEDIREDALAFLDIWVAAGGQMVVNGFWDKIIPNYISLLTSDSNATNSSKLASAMSFSASSSSKMVGSGSSTASGGSGTKVVAGATGKNAPGSLKAKSEVLQSLAGFLQEGLGGEGGEKDPYWFLRNFLGTAHARQSFNSTRTQIGAQMKSRKRKSKSSSGNSTSKRTTGRSVRKDGSSEEDSDDSEESDSDDESESSESDEESIQGENVLRDDALPFDASPVVSFGEASKYLGVLATFPVHPSTVSSSTIQAIFGNTQSSGNQGATSIPIKIFPQQGGASASGAGAIAGASGSGKTGSDNMNGVQGRLAQIRPLISTLHPLLLSVWLDTAPTVFASTTSIHAGYPLTICHLVIKIWGILWRAALAKPKKKNADTEEELEEERQEQKWLDEFLQSLLKHVLIYFPFGKDTVGMTDPKVSSLLQDMNTTYCELTSLFLLGSGTGRIRRVPKSSLKNTSDKAQPKPSNNKKVTSSYRPSNKAFKKQKQAQQKKDESSDDDDYDSEAEDDDQDSASRSDDMVAVQVETPAWADQVVDFVLDTLGWKNPNAESDEGEEETQMSTVSSDFKSEHLIALLPTLWTLLNCLETQRREWVFEAFMAYFDNAHVQSGTKRIVLQFLALVIKLQSHPHYTGSFTILLPGARPGTTNKSIAGFDKKDRKEQRASIARMSKLLSSSLLRLPKLLWDLGTERIETTQTVLDLLAWVAVIAGDKHKEAENEAEREAFVKTLQSYLALFFCVTMQPKGGQGEKRTILGPFVKLPLELQRRAIEIVFYSGAAAETSEKRQQKDAKSAPLLAAVKSCCSVGDLSDETRLYIEETLQIG